MTTKQQLIEDAYTAAGLASYVFDLTAKELAHADRAIQAMLALWSKKGVRIGYNAAGDLGDDAEVPDYAVEAITTNLALRLCGTVGKSVTPEIRSAATHSWNAVVGATAYIPERARNVNGVPAGAGNHGVDAWAIYLPETEKPLTTGEDGPLDLGA